METTLPAFERCRRVLSLVQIEQWPQTTTSPLYLVPVYTETEEQARAEAARIVERRGPNYRLYGITRHEQGFVRVHERQPGVIDDYRGPLPGVIDGKTLWILQHTNGICAHVQAI